MFSKMLTPSTKISPFCGLINPESMFNKVDFPVPLSPLTPIKLFFSIKILKLLKSIFFSENLKINF